MLKKKAEELDNAVRKQNLSPEEASKMKSDHELLEQQLSDLRQKTTEAQQNVLNMEVQFSNRAAAAEEALDDYERLLSILNLFQNLPPPYDHVSLGLELNTGAAPKEMLIFSSCSRALYTMSTV